MLDWMSFRVGVRTWHDLTPCILPLTTVACTGDWTMPLCCGTRIHTTRTSEWCFTWNRKPASHVHRSYYCLMGKLLRCFGAPTPCVRVLMYRESSWEMSGPESNSSPPNASASTSIWILWRPRSMHVSRVVDRNQCPPSIHDRQGNQILMSFHLLCEASCSLFCYCAWTSW